MFGETRFNVQQSNKYRYLEFNSEINSTNTLVLLHGMFGGLSNFDPLIDKVQNQQVFVPEIPIYNYEKDKLSIPELASWLHGVLTDHGIRHPVLLGNSMGGHIALQYALSHPDNVKALVLTGSSGLFENDLGSSCPKRYDREYVKERASLTFYDDLVDETIIDEILEVLQSPAKLSRLLRIARSTHEHNLEDQLGRIRQPTLLVWGKSDIITPPHVAETFLEKLPSATLKWIDKCGHAPMMERPDEFVGYLLDFLKSYHLLSENEKKIRHEEDYTHI